MGSVSVCPHRPIAYIVKLELKNISKSFPGVKALQQVSITFTPGEIHALCGENGAGKSTLMNIISGNLRPDAGDILLDGRKTEIENVLQAEALGIAIVYQERSLTDSLSVAENIYPVHQPRNRYGYIDHKVLHKNASEWLQQFRLTMHAATPVGKLSPSQKTLVEIIKALAKKPRILILDEPTASLTHEEADILFNMIRRLRADHVTVIYISHRMAEIRELADVVTVLKDGIFQGTVPSSTPDREIIRMMVGRELAADTFVSDVTKEVLLEVKELSGNGFEDISFNIYAGEILGFAGLTGCGRTALARTIFGDSRYNAGSISIKQRPYSPRHPANAINAHIAYLPEDRKTEGLFLERSIADNIASVSLSVPCAAYNAGKERETADSYVKELDIRTPSATTPVRKLSGGNQQKVVLAKWLATQPDLMIVNEPTHGVDVGAKTEIYNIMKKLTAAGKGIMMISSELPELLQLADRIAVMWQGKLITILSRKEATEEKLTMLASGL